MTTLNFIASVPVVGQTSLSGFMSTTAASNQRAMLRGVHTLGTGEGGFTGFTSRAGFTTQTVTTATALFTAMNAMSTTDRVIFKCQWNGVSNQTSNTVTGPSNASMTASGTVDWGYVRPVMATIIEPATGYTPTIGTPSGSTMTMDCSGTHWHEFNDMTFAGDLNFYPTVGYRNGIAIIAMNRCTLKGLLHTSSIRTLHMANCTTSGSGAWIEASCNYQRCWNHKGVLLTNALDGSHVFGIGGGYTAAWTINVWYAGCILQKMVPVTSGNHFDWLQYSITGDTGVGYNILVEFCTVNANSEDSQGIFTGNKVETHTNNFLIHNCIFAVNAYWAIGMCDASGAGNMIVDKILCLRGSLGPGPVTGTAAETTDAKPYIGATGSHVNAGGSVQVTKSYFWKSPGTEIVPGDDSGVIYGRPDDTLSVAVTLSGNIHMNPTSTAFAGDRPQDLLTGPFTFTTNDGGFLRYADPTAAISDPVAANNAFIAFVKPKLGWGVAAGPQDPATWPTNFDRVIT